MPDMGPGTSTTKGTNTGFFPGGAPVPRGRQRRERAITQQCGPCWRGGVFTVLQPHKEDVLTQFCLGSWGYVQGRTRLPGRGEPVLSQVERRTRVRQGHT